MRVIPRRAQIFSVKLRPGDAESRHAALPRAKQIPFPAKPQVFLGDAEAVFALTQNREPRFRGLAERTLLKQQAGRLAGAAADATPQLMDLR